MDILKLNKIPIDNIYGFCDGSGQYLFANKLLLFSFVQPIQYLFDLELYNSQEGKVEKTYWIASWKVIQLVKLLYTFLQNRTTDSIAVLKRRAS